MRTMHDAIMVGIGTALNDDPQLNSTRHGVFPRAEALTTNRSAARPAGAPAQVPPAPAGDSGYAPAAACGLQAGEEL